MTCTGGRLAAFARMETQLFTERGGVDYLVSRLSNQAPATEPRIAPENAVPLELNPRLHRVPGEFDRYAARWIRNHGDRLAEPRRIRLPTVILRDERTT